MNDPQVFNFLVSDSADGDAIRDSIDRLYLADEEELVLSLLAEAELDAAATERVNRMAQMLVTAVRVRKHEQGLLDAFMQE
ncbi:MAG: hypothetical protein PVI22_08680, partial [Lysobacterales bacterium]